VMRTPAAALAYQRDLPKAQIQIIGGGHWALESHGPEVIGLTREFLLSSSTHSMGWRMG
jgi:pimeloyl-ACP methyl ester carboxylesterase